MSLFRMRMSFRTTVPSALSTRTTTTRRTFQTSRTLLAGKETKPGTENPEARKAEIEEHKQAQLKEQKEGRNEWKEAIASESESIAKADRGELKTDKGSIEELQKESVKEVEKERK